MALAEFMGWRIAPNWIVAGSDDAVMSTNIMVGPDSQFALFPSMASINFDVMLRAVEEVVSDEMVSSVAP